MLASPATERSFVNDAERRPDGRTVEVFDVRLIEDWESS
jgi:hypothetical protein